MFVKTSKECDAVAETEHQGHQYQMFMYLVKAFYTAVFHVLSIGFSTDLVQMFVNTIKKNVISCSD